MKVISLICLLPFFSYGQYAFNNSSLSHNKNNQSYFKNSYEVLLSDSEPASRKKKTGVAFTIIGGSMFVAGASVFGTSDGDFTRGNVYNPSDYNAELGAALMIGGIAFFVPGIINLAMAKKKERENKLTLRFRRNGFSLRYRI